MDYKDQLSGYKKKLFDPFCRNKRIPFYYNETQYVITTVAQLNFFRWAISKKILDFVDNNFKEIYKDMQKKKEMIESEVLSTNDSAILTTKSLVDSSTSLNMQKTIYSSEKIEISFDV